MENVHLLKLATVEHSISHNTANGHWKNRRLCAGLLREMGRSSCWFVSNFLIMVFVAILSLYSEKKRCLSILLNNAVTCWLSFVKPKAGTVKSFLDFHFFSMYMYIDQWEFT